MRGGTAHPWARYALLTLCLFAASGAAPGAEDAPPPPKRRPSTGHDAFAAALAHNRRTLVDVYQRIGKKNPAWDQPAVRFLDAMAQYYSRGGLHEFYWPEGTPSAADALALGEAAVKAGCDDPLVLYNYGVCLTDTGKAEAARPVLLRADEGLQAGDYPLVRRYASAKRVAVISPDKDRAARAAATAADLRGRMLCGKVDDAARRTLLRIAWSDAKPAGRPAQQQLVAALDKAPDADPWVRDVIAGLLHIDLAWESRGNDFADKVTEAGWKGFFRHLATARDRLTRAWKLAPHLPEAPEAMISVAMGAGEQLGEKEFDWFDRALAAQVDWTPAYDRMYWALLPRWGGTYKQILEIGFACVQTGRYDTLVPWQLISALWQIRRDAGVEWPQLLKSQQVYDKVVEVAEGYAKAVPKRAGWYRTYHAAAAWHAGRGDEARQVLEALGKDAQPAAFADLGADDGALALAEVYARTGAHAATIREAEQTRDAGDPAAAAEKLRAVSRAVANDPSAPYVAAQLRGAEWRAKLETGQWVDIQPKDTLGGWRKVTGRWALQPDGTLLGSGDATTPQMMLVWTAGDLDGAAFELAGKFEFTTEPGAGKEAGGAGPAVVSEGSGRRGYVLFDRDQQAAQFLHATRSRYGPVEVRRSNDFLLRRAADGTVTVQLNGVEVVGPLTLAEGEFDPPVRFGVGGASRASVRYTQLRLRKTSAAAPDKPAVPDAAPPF